MSDKKTELVEDSKFQKVIRHFLASPPKPRKVVGGKKAKPKPRKRELK